MAAVGVIGAGFGRTGTLSLKRALEELGFGPTYHMEEVFRHPSHVNQWYRFATTGRADWDELFAVYRSTAGGAAPSVTVTELHDARTPTGNGTYALPQPAFGDTLWAGVCLTVLRPSTHSSDLRRCTLSHAMSFGFSLSFVSFFQNMPTAIRRLSQVS